MGGSAFACRKLLTPRMSPATYNHLKKKYHNILAGLYAHVKTPPEAPGKTSYGDLDFLVAGPLPQEPLVFVGTPDQKDVGKNGSNVSAAGSDHAIMKSLQIALGAEDSIKSSDTTSFAVPREATASDTENVGKTVYVQVDVHVCNSAEAVNWISFKHAYGDMWSILGMMARAKGLVADESCLNILVEEIENRDKKLSKVEITRDVKQTLDFFGLDVELYEKGFGTIEEVYAFIKGSRFFELKYFKDKAWSRAQDRRKVVKREMMKDWFEWLGVMPSETEEGLEENESTSDTKVGDTDKTEGEEEEEEEEEEEREEEEDNEKITREEVLEEALDRFGKRDIYDEKIKNWRRNEKINDIAGRISKALLEGEYCSIKSARKRASNLRRRLVAGELDDVLQMGEEDLQSYLSTHIEGLIEELKSRPVDALDAAEDDNGKESIDQAIKPDVEVQNLLAEMRIPENGTT